MRKVKVALSVLFLIMLLGGVVLAQTDDGSWLILTMAGLGRSEFVTIPGGVFLMGDSYSEGETYELPQHAVTVSAMDIGKYEVTKTLWDQVYQWAIAHGYTFDNVGAGKAANHPVTTISWYDAVKWCNARSEKEGLTPCYYTSGALDTVYRTGTIDLPNSAVRPGAGGYRLPTEAEWEKAARAGLAGYRFPWPDIYIQHARANYFSSVAYAYDTSPTRGNNPPYATGAFPYTSPVGSFAANGYGVYDVAGNVFELCWDWYGETYYSATEGAVDPTGPATGYARISRGGAWGETAYFSRVADRYVVSPAGADMNTGFRVVKKSQAAPTPTPTATPTPTPTPDIVAVPAGNFIMGDSYSEGDADELPQHNVYVSSICISITEVSKTLWTTVYAWAVEHGYEFENAGLGKTPTDPVHTVNWYDAVKWCNARSELEGLPLMYETWDVTAWVPYRTGHSDTLRVSWTSKGYRLPTEAEWEKAARGGSNYLRFPWSHLMGVQIDGEKANYLSRYPTGEAYDLGPNGYAAAWATLPMPYTGPCESYPTTGSYGLYNMAGNVSEWCWDWYSSTYYGGETADPTGPASGTTRVIRGGSWSSYPNKLRNASRDADLPWIESYSLGFRCVRIYP